MTEPRFFTVGADNSDSAGSVSDALLGALAELESECFGTEAWSAEGVRSFVSNPAVLTVCAACGDALAGMASAVAVCDEAEITKVATAPEYRRRGIAARLLAELEAALRPHGIRRLLLEVREGNSPARALYASAGFTELSRRAGYYALPREDAVIMEKLLTEKNLPR